MPITEMLSRNARMYSDEVSLIEREPAIGSRKEITWLEFENQSNKIANCLIEHGITRGDKVILLLMNCLEWLPSYFGILKAGAMAVPLNFRFTAEEIKKCIEAAEGKVLIYGPEFCERVDAIRNSLLSVESYIFVGEKRKTEETCYMDITYSELMGQFPSDNPGIEISDYDEAALYFTSGTTGMPKPIILTHANLVSACITENRHHLQSHEDNFLCIPPLYHTGAKMHWFGSLIVGSKAVILKGVKPQWILEAVSEEKATIVWLLVPWAQDILDAIESGEVDLKNYNIKQWRLMHIGAQPVPPSLIQRWKKYFPDHLYDTNYGLSESTGPGCVHLGIENIHKVGAIGLPGFNWEIKIVDCEGNPVTNGTVGELIIRGPGVMKGYYKNPEATAKVLRNGWLYTGDMAKKDEDGFIYLVDRKKDVVISGGENIFPVEIENYLQAHEDIKDAAVIGMPDRRLGEIPVAVIETKPGRQLTESMVIEFCRDLPKYKRPRKIIFDKVPRNPTGKIEKPKLREKWCGNTKTVFV
ncbi:MAG TPA: class I adenylate-forming enzyme family protein [Clostridiales bacterium]|nr:class I adenylate-forming enzyme family protein [Clostridiales bacterium]